MLVRAHGHLYNQENQRKKSGNVWTRSCILQSGTENARRKGPNLEERLKSLMQDLGNAINESLSESERIAEAIGEIKSAGYDVFLVLEATIGFNKREESRDEIDDAEEAPTVEPTEVTSIGKVRFTTQDQRFLKALRITVDEEA